MLKPKYFIVLIFVLCFINLKTKAQPTNLEVAAYTFSIQPKVGTPSDHTNTGHKIEKVYGDLKSTLILFKQGNNKMVMLTSSVVKAAKNDSRKVLVQILSKAFNIPKSAVVINSAHNHTAPALDLDHEEEPEEGTPKFLVWELSGVFLGKLDKAADYVSQNLKPVTVEWGKAEENRITYNRKGRRLDGTSYFMREEDRLKLKGKGYHGLIDPDAVVVLFRGYNGKPVAALSYFTGHPVAAYNPEKLISYGQFPQAASEALSEYFHGIPVAFIQGAAGNIASKYMLTGTIKEAKQLGNYLGNTFIVAAKSLRKSKRIGFEWSKERVNIPLSKLPSRKKLQTDVDSIDAFVRRGRAGDKNTLECVGMNFPHALSPAYRAKLVEMVRPWYVWALKQRKTNNVINIPEYFPIKIVVARFGDVGFVGMPFEAFVQTGLKIKRDSNLPYVLTAGYTNGNYGYIPNANGVDDREYMSGDFRYIEQIKNLPEPKIKSISKSKRIYSAHKFNPPYKAPGGDVCAVVGVKKINEFAR